MSNAPINNTFTQKQPVFVKLAEPIICHVCTRFTRHANFQIWYKLISPSQSILSNNLWRRLSFIRVLLKTLRSALIVGTLLVTSQAMAIPLEENTTNTNTPSTENTVLQDPQVAPAPASPFVYPDINTQGSPSTQADNNSQQPLAEPKPNPLNNPDTLASQLQPTDNTLSQANQELLSRNALLQRDINDLQTQVNVLVKERSGQLFMYGAFTVAVSILLGFFIGWFVFGRRDRW